MCSTQQYVPIPSHTRSDIENVSQTLGCSQRRLQPSLPLFSSTSRPDAQATIVRLNFEDTGKDVYVHSDTELTENSLGKLQLQPMKRVVTDASDIDMTESDARIDDIRERTVAGEFFFTPNEEFFVVENS